MNKTWVLAGLGLGVVAVVLLTRKPAAAPVAPPPPVAPPVASGGGGAAGKVAGYAALAAGLISTGIGLYGQGQNAGLF